MNRFLYNIFIVTVLFLWSNVTYSQLSFDECHLKNENQHFYGGFIVGITTSQVDGDENDGFHCMGGTGGIFVERHNKYGENTFELSFAQKGAADAAHSFRISTGYVDATYLFQFHPAIIFKEELFRWQIGTTLSAKIYENVNFSDKMKQKSEDFSRLDWQAVAGIDCHISQWLSFDTRASYSIIPINDRFRNFVVYLTLRIYPTLKI